MTLREVISAIKNRTMAQEAGEIVSKEIRAIRREFIGKADVETFPTGLRVNCVIIAIDWVDSYGMTGGWSVRVIYTEGSFKGTESETSDKVLDIMGSR